MNIEQIAQKARALVRKSDTRDPLRIAKDCDVLLLFSDMGTQEDSCKGFYLCQNRIRCITVNSTLSPAMQRIITAHELGHAVLHRHTNETLHDFGLFSDASVLEYEANLFAADLLLSDEETFAALNECADFFCAAVLLRVPPQLLDFKLRILQRLKRFPAHAPIVSHGDFLRTFCTPHEPSS